MANSLVLWKTQTGWCGPYLKESFPLERSRKATVSRLHLNQDLEGKRELSHDQGASTFHTQGTACVKVLKQKKKKFTYLRNPEKASVPGIKGGRERLRAELARPMSHGEEFSFYPKRNRDLLMGL